MKKERQPLTKREKVLLGLGIVGVGVAGYFGYKYIGSTKLVGELRKENYTTNAVKDALEETKKELKFLKFLVIEGDIIPHAKQNATNKLSRHYTKLERLLKHVEERGEDTDTIKAIALEREEIAIMVKNLRLTESLEEAVNNDECIYAK
jgi:hypothetical protein